MAWTVRAATPADLDALPDLVRGLDAWFDENGRRHIPIDARFQRVLAALDGERVVGFACYFVYEGVGRLAWIGCDVDRRRRGIGRALVEHVAAEMRDAGVAEVLVDTLGDSVDYEPYAETRAFYEALGFAAHERVFLDNPNCPERLTLKLIL
jgi:ribosomal protein S18 acetylase RimI-like enzyme